MEIFNLEYQSSTSGARTGTIDLPHGKVKTPAFMPVGTHCTVKAMTKEALEEIGFEIILANTYHLFLRPGPDLIKEAGGLHGFSGWKRNFLTDSGGFQVFSLSGLRKITDEGVRFQSHLDGSTQFLSPEIVVDVQAKLNSDIQMVLDVCSPYGIDFKQAESDLQRTILWGRRAKKSWLETKDYQGKLFAIIQGNFYKELRIRSVEEVLSLDTPGIAIGGLSVGEPFELYAETLNYTAAMLPGNKPRYVMGIGTPDFILEAVENGIDLFDCVLPTRVARNGAYFTRNGLLSIKKECFTHDMGPADPDCNCPVCRQYSRAYLRHLFKSNEILSSMLASYHNLYFLHKMILEIRDAIRSENFISYKKEFLNRYNSNRYKLKQ